MPTLNFILDFPPPRATHQQKGERIVGSGKNAFIHHYEKKNVKNARSLFMAHLTQPAPETPIKGPVRLVTVWGYKAPNKKAHLTPKITRPDTDNIIKLLKDCMTQAGFWDDDSQVYDDRIIKRWTTSPGIIVSVQWGDSLQEVEQNG